MLPRRTLWVSIGFATLLTLAGAGLLVRVVADGLGRNRTMLALFSARTAWKQGRTAQALHNLMQASWMALDGGLRWQVAEYYVEQSVDLKNQHRLTEAAKACLRASDVLGPYDNLSGHDRRCDLMSWEYEQSP